MDKDDPKFLQEPRVIPGQLRVVITAMADDYLTCRTWNGSAQGSVDILVAKFWTARKSVWDGKMLNGISYASSGSDQRTATQGATTETQVIVPPYYVGAELSIQRVPNGGTGIVVGSAALSWVDSNADGRAWARKSMI